MSKPIYEPTGKAREYSPLALNLYNGCDHQCDYCYTRTINKKLYSPDPTPKKNILSELEKQLIKERITKQVLLSFIGDPYCKKEDTEGLTRKALEIILKHHPDMPIAILSKGAHRLERDFDLFKQFKTIKLGQTLTYGTDNASKIHEPGAPTSYERLEFLKLAKKAGFKTFVSLEPVVNPRSAILWLTVGRPWVDHFKIGKMNYQTADINWNDFTLQALQIVRMHGIPVYFKEALRKACKPKTVEMMTDDEKDQDFLNLPPLEEKPDTLF